MDILKLLVCNDVVSGDIFYFCCGLLKLLVWERKRWMTDIFINLRQKKQNIRVWYLCLTQKCGIIQYHTSIIISLLSVSYIKSYRRHINKNIILTTKIVSSNLFFICIRGTKFWSYLPKKWKLILRKGAFKKWTTYFIISYYLYDKLCGLNNWNC